MGSILLLIAGLITTGAIDAGTNPKPAIHPTHSFGYYHPPTNTRSFPSFLVIVPFLCHDSARATSFLGPAAYWWPGQAWTQPAIACFVLGGLSFVPGAYAVYIAVRAYRGDPGFSFDMIPTVQ